MGRPSLLSSLSFPPLPSPGLLSLSALPQLVCQSHFWLSEVPPLEPPPPLSSPPSQPSLVVPSPSRPSASSSQALDAPRGQLMRRMALLLPSLPIQGRADCQAHQLSCQTTTSKCFIRSSYCHHNTKLNEEEEPCDSIFYINLSCQNC